LKYIFPIGSRNGRSKPLLRVQWIGVRAANSFQLLKLLKIIFPFTNQTGKLTWDVVLKHFLPGSIFAIQDWMIEYSSASASTTIGSVESS
jgi:hypothetical protein